MRTSRVVSITLPPALLKKARALAKAESRTMSELVREALRKYEQERAFDQVRAKTRSAANMLGLQNEEDVVRMVRGFRRQQQSMQETAPRSRTGTLA